MSFTDEVVNETIEAPAEEITPDETVGQGEPEAPAPEPQRLDTEAYGNHLVTIKVDGEEMEVPLADLRNGYMRQEAFTRKSQENAERLRTAERWQQLEAALQNNPDQALQWLREQYQPHDPPPQADPYEGMTPNERRLAQQLDSLQGWVSEREYEQAYTQVEQQVEQIVQFFGEDVVTRDELLKEAARLQTPHLDLVAEAIAGRKFVARQAAEREAQANRSGEDERRQAAAVAADISSSPHNVTSPAQGYQGGRGIAGALEAAMNQLGLDDAQVWGSRD